MSSLFSLVGGKALITGGASGIGLACARAFVELGCKVVVVDIELSRLRSAEQELVAYSNNVGFLKCDVSDEKSVDLLALQAQTFFGPIDILVNNAGISPRSARLHEISYLEWTHVLRVNLDSVFLMSRAFIPQLLQSERSTIINVSSISGMVGLRDEFLLQSAYCASKSAIIGLTRQIAAEYGSQGLRCNAIAPGWHLGTQLGNDAGNFAGLSDLLSQRVSKRTSLSRPGHAEELVGLFVFLASHASSYVNGSVMVQDGGWTAI